MQVKVVKKFRDVQTKKIRYKNDMFECSEERFFEIEAKGHFVEEVTEDDQEPESDNKKLENGQGTGSGNVGDIAHMSMGELKSIAKEKKVKNYTKMSQEELVAALAE